MGGVAVKPPRGTTPVGPISSEDAERAGQVRFESETRQAYRPYRGREVLCRLSYKITPFRPELDRVRVELIGIEELE